jgi:outer membrane lipoprotein-sorting protein
MPAQSTTDTTPSARDIVEKSRCAAYYQGSSRVSRVNMNIEDSQKRSRKRQLTILRDNKAPSDSNVTNCEDQNYYVYFHRPSDLKKTTFLVWKHLESDDDRWLYLPALDLVKRIAASDKRTSFAGSHYFYEDISGRNIAEDSFELVETSDEHYVVKGKPKDPKSVEFANYTAWIDRNSFIPNKVEYFDDKGEKYRVCEALEIVDVNGFPTVARARVKDLRSGGQTTVTYSKVAYGVSLEDEIFSERYLRKPPRRHLR